jgi:hypothetical protein
MPAEGMVHALRRAHRVVKPRGCVVDLHPTNEPATVETHRTIGYVDAGDAPRRHGQADAAVAAAVGEGLFAVDRTLVFSFYTYGENIDDLRAFVETTWRDALIGAATVERARQALRRAPAGTRPRVREVVRVTKLRPIS